MNHITDATLWALGVVEAHDNHDATGVAALMDGMDPNAAVEHLAGLAAGLILTYCLEIQVNPKDWLANVRAQALLGGAAMSAYAKWLGWCIAGCGAVALVMALVLGGRG